jgi:hypothetical protein
MTVTTCPSHRPIKRGTNPNRKFGGNIEKNLYAAVGLNVVRWGFAGAKRPENNGVADTLKPDGGWVGLRDHSTYHYDTLTDRLAP